MPSVRSADAAGSGARMPRVWSAPTNVDNDPLEAPKISTGTFDVCWTFNYPLAPGARSNGALTRLRSC